MAHIILNSDTPQGFVDFVASKGHTTEIGKDNFNNFVNGKNCWESKDENEMLNDLYWEWSGLDKIWFAHS